MKYGVANNFAKVVQLKTLKAIEKIKALDEETFFGLTSFVGEPFTLKLGNQMVRRTGINFFKKEIIKHQIMCFILQTS